MPRENQELGSGGFADRNYLNQRFCTSHVFLIAVQDYCHVARLQTPVNDVQRLAEVLEMDAHDYCVHPLLINPTKSELEIFLSKTIPALVGADDRVMLYFAGHGIAVDEEARGRPKGYLLPVDARRDDEGSYVSMKFLNEHLDRLPCRHLLLLLDCCFAGSFQWAEEHARGLVLMNFPKQIYLQRFDLFVKEKAWQVMTSAAYNQKALDVVSRHALGQREEEGGHDQSNSPFAQALLRALRDGEGDLVPSGGDGLMTITEIFTFIQEQLAQLHHVHAQKPTLFHLPQHQQGEYLFLNPRKKLFLTAYEDHFNPYRGLQSYSFEDRTIFYGRAGVIPVLRQRLKQSPMLVVSGASGSGKSSVVLAGLLPLLKENGWNYIAIRPGVQPLLSLEAGLGEWKASYSSTALFIDQFEELVTQCTDRALREAFLERVHALIQSGSPIHKIIVTVRADFEPQFENSILREFWQEARYNLPGLTYNELEEIIVQPAYERCISFEPRLTEELISAVQNKPGGLPLLSFALAELYERFKIRRVEGDESRQLTWSDYHQIGGVEGALRYKADEIYESLTTAEGDTMQKIMLRMVSLEGGEASSRRVMQDDLIFPDAGENKRVTLVLDLLVTAKLVVADLDASSRPFYEPAHDAFVRAWKKLWDWIDVLGKDRLLVLNKLQESALEYQDSRHSKDLWHNNPRLAIISELKKQATNWMNAQERDFFTASVRKKRFNRLRLIGTVLAVIASLSVLTIFAYAQLNRAESSERRAISEQHRAEESEQRAEDSAKVAQIQRQIAVVAQQSARDSARVAQIQRNLAKSNEDSARIAQKEAEFNLRKFQTEQREKEKVNCAKYIEEGKIALDADEYDLALRRFNLALQVINQFGMHDEALHSRQKEVQEKINFCLSKLKPNQ